LLVWDEDDEEEEELILLRIRLLLLLLLLLFVVKDEMRFGEGGVLLMALNVVNSDDISTKEKGRNNQNVKGRG
jgi:hypothetical protein